QCLRRLQLLADREDVAQISSFDELHDDVPLASRYVLVHRENLDDAGMAKRQADAALSLKQVDALLVLAPAAAQDLDGHDALGFGVFRPKNAAETAGRDL